MRTKTRDDSIVKNKLRDYMKQSYVIYLNGNDGTDKN